MKSQRVLLMASVVLLTLVLAPNGAAAQGPTGAQPRAPRTALGTAFTYQGQLKQSGNPVNGVTCDFQFGLYDALTGPTQIGTTQTASALVTNGYFTISSLDFGSGAFNGDARWLDIQVRCPTGSGSYTPLTPRQALTPAPMALALPGLYTQQNATSPNIIGGYSDNWVTSGVDGATIGGGGASANLNRVTDDYGVVGGGYNNQAGDNAGATSDRPYATVGGGGRNTASARAATVGGGWGNTARNYYATVGGGYQNTASGDTATVGGGYQNTASGQGAFIGGGGTDGTSIHGNHADGNGSTIGGGLANIITVAGLYATVGGGFNNTTSGSAATVGGGYHNSASNDSATIGGGSNNTASGAGAFVGGGGYDGTNIAGNQAVGNASTIGGGYNNTASGSWNFIGGGRNNSANNDDAVVGGGASNSASGKASTVPGGYLNVAQGANSFAAGTQAKAYHNGAFVWGDNNYTDVASTADNQFIVRASGGITMYTNSGMTNGVQVPPGSGTWGSVSDRNLKANFQNVNSQDVLARVSALPIQTWNYTTQDPSIHHIGPMAQDFYAAFNVGEDDKHITTIDSEGVALAAIQGLNQIAQAQDKEIAALKSENAAQQKQIADLDARLTALEQSTVAAKSPPNDFASNGWMLGALLVAVVFVGTRRWGGAR